MIHLNEQERLLLADCVRLSFVGWSLNCPTASPFARRIEIQATTIAGFNVSRFMAMLTKEFGDDYRPGCSTTMGQNFPLTSAEACALANDIEFGFATDEQVKAAGLIARRSPYAQPTIGSKSWNVYRHIMKKLDLKTMEGNACWSQFVRDQLVPFRGTIAVAQAEAVTHIGR